MPDPYSTETLAERLAGLELSPVPVWVLDPDAARISWANDPALELWRASSREELYSRHLAGAPKAMKTRLDAAFASVREGKSFWDEWTFYPKGTPIRVKLHFAPLRLDGGSIGILHHVLPRDEGPEPAQLRGVEALTHTSVIVALVDFEGKVVMKNPAAIEAFGREADDWKVWLADPEDAAAMLAKGAAGEVSRRDLVVRTGSGERVHSVELRPVRDAVTGAMMALIHHTDETARLGAEVLAEAQTRLAEDLDRTLSVVEAQRREILTLSAPLLDVANGALAVPIIGPFDAERSADVEARLLPAIAARQCRFVILDMTGAASLDGSGAAFLLRIVRAVRLLGARPILTGIRPALARSLAESGFDAGRLPILRSLADGIRAAR